jgi:hypothetical protein
MNVSTSTIRVFSVHCWRTKTEKYCFVRMFVIGDTMYCKPDFLKGRQYMGTQLTEHKPGMEMI